MREYLFRGKRVDNDEWVEGYYVKAQKLDGSNKYEYFIIEEAATGQSHLVIPKTVGEFTGIYDISKKKIFENDIVRTQPFTDRPHSSKAKSKQHIGVVEYCKPELRGDHFKQTIYDAKWRVKVKDYGKYVCSNWSDFFNCEVIGNVFDDIDLLEE